MAFTKIYKQALKAYLGLHTRFHAGIVARLQQPMSGGVHYTNIFNRRYEFFRDNVKNDDVILDIACGTGTILKKLASHVRRGYGIDLAESNLAHCIADSAAYPNLSFEKADIFGFDYLAFQQKTGATVAVLSHILEHIEWPSSFLRQLNFPRLLICVPSEEHAYADLIKSVGLVYKTDNTHFREYTREELVRHLADGGYVSEWIGFNQDGEIICIANRRVA